MADTPSYPVPLDSREQAILENLQRIRDELTLLKQDRSTYVKSSDVMVLYDKVIDQVHLLNEIRTDKPQEDNRCQYWPLPKISFPRLKISQWIES
jgi:hypothetical protein